jgi:hypothetical protein
MNGPASSALLSISSTPQYLHFASYQKKGSPQPGHDHLARCSSSQAVTPISRIRLRFLRTTEWCGALSLRKLTSSLHGNSPHWWQWSIPFDAVHALNLQSRQNTATVSDLQPRQTRSPGSISHSFASSATVPFLSASTVPQAPQ